MSEEYSTEAELCRLCLTDEGVTCPIFAEGPQNLSERIFECTSIEVERIDGVPSNICEICKSKLVICLQFIRQCRKTQEKIQELYEQHFQPQKCNNPCNESETGEIELIEYAPEQDETDENDRAKAPATEEVSLIEYVEQPSQKGLGDQYAPKKNATDENLGQEESDNVNDNVVSQNASEIRNVELVKAESVIIHEGGVKRYKKKCPICGVLQQNLKQHMNVHSGVRKHVCSFCGKAFSQRGNLTCHLNIHTGHKPHKCDQCGKSFSDPTGLKMHKINHSDEANFQCSLCQTTFRYKHSLQTHLRSHRNERNHACTYCDMAFVTSSSLKKHIRTHTGERPYKCDLCTKSFISGGHLQQHKKSHLRNKLYQCEKCETAFSSKATLKRHMTEHTTMPCA